MENMMQEYLESDYSTDYFRNFCLYWVKGLESLPEWENTDEGRARYNAWRKENELDCLYLKGDLRADTPFSVWTPIKWG